MKTVEPMENDVLVEKRGGELEEGEGEGRALCESRWIAETEDVRLDFGRDGGERRRGSGEGPAEFDVREEEASESFLFLCGGGK